MHEASEAARFAPLFDARHAQAYAVFASVFPAAAAGGAGDMRRLVEQLAVHQKINAPFTDAVAGVLANKVAGVVSGAADSGARLLLLDRKLTDGTPSASASTERSGDNSELLMADKAFVDPLLNTPLDYSLQYV